ncbi:hypothetical protein SCHPADRAFT_939618 [Schizopora paradoxa]|uniref:Uncharacterized protein n=1 Tax=Schizopora paradoxa TaxID=27342 RepID=A0A0H2RQR6_9AGAM|nr:hypothetical protein SCHPADRAFT_939618 [Schizopora paradoxa]
MSNLPGPGRLLGNFYSKAGSSLERGLRKLVTGASSRRELVRAKSIVNQQDSLDNLLLSSNISDAERACDALLICARSNDRDLQAKAFESIIFFTIFLFPVFRPSLKIVYKRRGVPIDVDVRSWKREGIEYNTEWLYFYKLASRCLDTDPNSMVETAARFSDSDFRKFSLSNFEELLSNCRNSTDFLLSCRFIFVRWHANALHLYVKKNGFGDPVLIKFATTFVGKCEGYFTQDIIPDQFVEAGIPLRTAISFISDMWETLKSNEFGALAKDDSQTLVWNEIFKLHSLLYGHEHFKKRLISNGPKIAKSWGELCRERLPKAEHAEIREKLLLLGRTKTA